MSSTLVVRLGKRKPREAFGIGLLGDSGLYSHSLTIFVSGVYK